MSDISSQTTIKNPVEQPNKKPERKIPMLLIGLLSNAIMGIISYKILFPILIKIILNIAMQVTALGIFTEILKGFAPVFLGAIAINLALFFSLKKYIEKKGLYLFLTGLCYLVFLVGTFMLFEFIGY